MAWQAKSCFGGNRLATGMAIAALMVSGGVTASRAHGAMESARDIRAAASPASSPASKPAARSPIEEKARVNAGAGKRDPFKVPPPPRPNGGGEMEGSLPPGARGLVIGHLKLEGIVREDATSNMIAVVTGRTDLAYFLRVHDEVYNGVVTRITPDSIYFLQNQPGAGGSVETREVVLKLAP
jgi:hypothetical protein